MAAAAEVPLVLAGLSLPLVFTAAFALAGTFFDVAFVEGVVTVAGIGSDLRVLLVIVGSSVGVLAALLLPPGKIQVEI